MNTNAQNINNDNDSIVEFPNVVLKFDITRTDCPLRQDWFIFADDITKTKTFIECQPLVGPIMSIQGIGEWRLILNNIDDNSNLNLTKDELYKCDILSHIIPNISYGRGQKQIKYIDIKLNLTIVNHYLEILKPKIATMIMIQLLLIILICQ